MLVIKIVIAVIALVAIIACVKKFNAHCTSKFGHAFFTKSAFYVTTAALVLLILGGAWRADAIQNNGDALNGTVVMILGIVLAGCLVYLNIRRTNAVYGVCGSVVQLGLFAALAWVSLPLMVFALLGQFFLIATAKPVYVVNR